MGEEDEMSEFEKKVSNIWCIYDVGLILPFIYMFIGLSYKGHIHIYQYLIIIPVKLLCGC